MIVAILFSFLGTLCHFSLARFLVLRFHSKLLGVFKAGICTTFVLTFSHLLFDGLLR